jgi:hypothetical protein
MSKDQSMADEPEVAGSGDRPVEPPIIDLEAQEVEKAGDSQQEQPAGSPEENRARAPFGLLSLPVVLAGMAIILAGASLAAVLMFVDFKASGGGDGSLSPRLEALEASGHQVQAQIGDLTAAINALRESTAQQAGAAPGEQAAASQQLQQLESSVQSLSGAIEEIGAALNAIKSGQGAQQDEIRSAAGAIAELQARLNQEGQPPPAASPAVPAAPPPPAAGNELASALLKLKTAVEEGRPFAGELQALSAALPAAGQTNDLAALAASGVVRASDLVDRLQRIVAELNAPAPQPTTSEPQGVWDTFKSKAASLISVRKLDEARWLDATARALERLKQGDLREAVQILGSVEGQPPAEVDAWLKDARALLSVNQAIDGLSASVLKQLGSGS